MDKREELKERIRKLRGIEAHCEQRTEMYRKQSREAYDKLSKAEKSLSKLDHKYERGDLVVMKKGFRVNDTYSVAKILELIPVKRYRAFMYNHFTFASEERFAEDKILCKLSEVRKFTMTTDINTGKNSCEIKFGNGD